MQRNVWLGVELKSIVYTRNMGLSGECPREGGGLFLNDSSLYIREYRRKPQETPDG